MIFDIYIQFDFEKTDVPNSEVSFKSEEIYKNIIGKETTILLKNGYVNSLNRNDFNDSFSESNETMLWVFGETFSNNKFYEDRKIKPHKINASDILELYAELKDSATDYLKGNFVLVLFSKKTNEFKIITERLNVLPLYFAYDKSKLIISSNTSLILKSEWVDSSANKLAYAMQYLFDYMLGEHFFVNGIKRFENARVYTFSIDGLHSNQYWDVQKLYNKELLHKTSSLDMLAKQLEENVKLYSTDKDKLLVAFTGGFDGRTNIALLNDRDKSTYRAFSYGMPGSKQIRVPQDASSKLGIDYKPVYLEKEYVDSYLETTKEATYFSNGTAPVGFNNIPFAYKKLNSYSDTVLTGLFGSEILRPLHNNGIQVNDNSFDIFLSDNYRQNITNAIKKGRGNGIITSQIDDDIANELADYFDVNYFEKYSKYDEVIKFFFFIIQEGIRKYFSQEISLQRVYVNTRIPYFDSDIVELIYKTTWAGMYNGFLGKSKFKRRKGQLLYAHVIKKYLPKLGDLVLDRGYTSNDLLLPFPLNYIKLAKGVYFAKKYMKKNNGNDTFKTEEWSVDSVNEIVNELQNNIPNTINFEFFKKNINKMNSGSYLTFRHFLSLSYYLKSVAKNE